MAGIQPGTYRPDEGFPDSAYFGPGQTYNDAPNRMPGAPPGFIMNPYLPAAPKKPTIQPYLNPTPVPPNVGRGAYIPDDKEKIDESSDESNRRTPQYDGGVSEGYGTVGRDLAEPGALLELLKAIPQVLSQVTPYGMANTASQILTDRTIPANIRGLLSVFRGGVPSVPTTTSDSYSYGRFPLTVDPLPEPPVNIPQVTIEQLAPPSNFEMSLAALLETITGVTTNDEQVNNARIEALQDAKYAPEPYDAAHQDYLMDEQQKAYDDALSAAGGY